MKKFPAKWLFQWLNIWYKHYSAVLEVEEFRKLFLGEASGGVGGDVVVIGLGGIFWLQNVSIVFGCTNEVWNWECWFFNKVPCAWKARCRFQIGTSRLDVCNQWTVCRSSMIIRRCKTLLIDGTAFHFATCLSVWTSELWGSFEEYTWISMNLL